MSDPHHLAVAVDADGVALVTWDSPGRSMNVITLEVMDELDALIDRIAGDADVKGAIIASGKKDFSGGADITLIHALFSAFEDMKASEPEDAVGELVQESSRLSRIYRRLETCGKPVVVAVAGTCLGGGTELALAAHGRVMADDRATKIGLPEVKIGIFPGAGGTQRVMRMTDPQAGLEMLLKGSNLDARKAKAMGLVDEVAPRAEIVAVAKRMLADGLDPVRPWDRKDFRLSGAQKIYSPAGMQLWPAANAIYRRETHDNYPGARGIMQSCYEGLLLPFDQALAVESRYFANVLQTRQAAAMIRSLFVSMQALNKGARRPAEVPPTPLRTVGVLGAGFMGSGIAQVTAAAGIDVVLIDRDMETAEQGKAAAADRVKKAASRGFIDPAEAEPLIARIRPAADYAALADADLVIEAVFEDRAVKRAVIQEAMAHLKPEAIFASNTSTLPITSLAENFDSPADFVGIHFFSPVDRMMLVEIIRGDKTGPRSLAAALDYVRAIRKTPIVVNDSRGFYANRCVMAYLLEGHKMLIEGVPPAMVENLARQAGMPVGPLALTDDVGVDLAWKIVKATEADIGEQAIDPDQRRLLQEMVVARERLGRKSGKGFYDYSGRDKALWPGLADIVPPRPVEEYDRVELTDRLLVTQALEAARTVAEGVVTDPREADVGSILGFGFAPWSGGTLSYIDGMGAPAFVARCNALAKRHGSRFRPNRLLRNMAVRNETFYGRFGSAAAPAD